MNEDVKQEPQNNKHLKTFDSEQMLISVISRSEAVSIIIDVINAIIDFKEKSGEPFSEELISTIQAAISAETNITTKLCDQLQASLNPSNVVDPVESSKEEVKDNEEETK